MNPSNQSSNDWTPSDEADHYEIARSIALRKLEMRAQSRSELASALAKKNVPREVAEAVLNRLTEVGLINDADFAAAWARSRHTHRKLGRRHLSQELRLKGVDDESIAAAISQIDDESEFEAAMEVARKKYRTIAHLDRIVVRRRICGALTRKGYGSGTIASVLGELHRDGGAEQIG